jgi:hypothetical protein
VLGNASERDTHQTFIRNQGVLNMRDREGWEKGNSGEQVVNGKTYKNLTQFTRKCATCGEPFSIYVTRKIASGHADSNSFGLKNCERHRRNKTVDDSNSMAELREELKGMQELREEWSAVWKICHPLLSPFGLVGVDTFGAAAQAMYAKHKETFDRLQVVEAENVVLRAQLAKYDLPAAFAQQQNKMPWELK